MIVVPAAKGVAGGTKAGGEGLCEQPENTFWRMTMGRGLLLWLIGIPIPIILLIWLFGGLH
jgi:hypothetical protein